ncbi:MAG: YhgE/Pip domain-containing protein [Bifidobacterium merycicum]|uniref:YhgE/Pip N-terminal domain protein n=2 Tax=Bifidobacterium merycicum TaxID=78345 RepID=A0A087BD76_9BIFI|nr:YhgE/Pip domain-containing protein [Bifidobacterium merycicum]MBQ1513272.1 YhgE/Pip domain-containing protein [Bifidobacterium sp.]KFI68976.1 YhgE/Pip N-terminal domain protein [Bifidobacterium merycicum]MEE1294373.1 YhgE/Pip domain-containing protein [Bifidobacterium merycicum]MEE3341841.1 YhgE/Pip domain-containing protein [Bifidobacterium merycicum]SHE74858.1 putative membrane protein [Bifidobacterium merycicum DSM 6492]
MKLIWGIFKRDMCHATRNVIAVIVSMGLVVVPALYAWFNIAASWDPYGNTKALKVAVANNDKGYKSDLVPVRINVGETIISTLRANDQLDWQFVNSDKAIDGVESGEYYAAIVIPKSFSADMMTLFSPDIKHAQLKYYLNEKINPIAPHITDQGATTVVNTIDKTFAKTIAQVGLDLASNILRYSQSPQMAEYMRNLDDNLTTVADTLTGASQQVTSYSQLLGSANDIVDSTGRLLSSATKAGRQARNALKQGKSGATSITSAGASVTSSVNTALNQVSDAFDQVAAKVNKAFDALGTDSTTAANQLKELSEQISSGESLYDTYITSLKHMRASVEQLPDGDAAKQALLDAIDREIALLEAAKGDTQKLAQELKDASTQVTQNAAAAEHSRKEILGRIASAKQSITDVRDDYTTNVKPKIDALASTVSTLISQTDGMITQLNGTADDLDDVTSGVGSNVASIQSTLGAIAKKLDSSAATVKELITKLDAGDSDSVSDSGESDELRALTTANASTLSTLISAPVALHRVAVYPIANYGSAMAPFYTILSIWVGAIILCAMLKVTISDREKAHVLGLGDALPRIAGPSRPGNASRWGLRLDHEYFGRYAIFALLALLQGTLVCLGDMYFLGVQANHALQFLAVGWLAALVFSNIVYTLTVSFGDIGKAVAVVLLVMQVAGSGGTFPIETLPKFFQLLYPFLPFPHAIDAMHAAMAGSYGNEYLLDMVYLALFLIPSLLLGLVLRKPVIRLNTWVSRNLESTKVM